VGGGEPGRSSGGDGGAAVGGDGDDGEGDGEIRLPDNLALAEAEQRYARAILARAGGNQSAAARQLGISRNKLARLLKG
jgi:Nif-specific regulatory protein